MSLPMYSEYKNSGVEWLGMVPSHWTVMSIKRLSAVQRGASPRPIDDPKYFNDDGEFSWVRIADVSASDGVLKTTTQRMSELGASLSVKINPGELFVSIAGTVGKPCISAIKACIHDGFVYFPYLKIAPKFLYRIFEAGTCYGGLGKFGTQLNLNTDTIGSIPIAVPPEQELPHILGFLDRETAKIDALIAEQEKLITLLTEKRQATISHAVTKGLDPNAPMKDSGVEWLGKVPAHWLLTPLARIALDRCDGPFGSGIKSEHYRDEGALVVRLQNIRAGAFNKGESVYLDKDYFLDELQGHDVVAEDLLIAGLGDDNNLLGRACVAPSELGLALVKADCFRFRLNSEQAVPHFVAWQLSCGAAYDAGVLSTGTTRSRIPLSVMASRKVALPPHSEQDVIAKFIASENEKLDTLTAGASCAVVLLRERRSALIAAAVTGKIDVRGAMSQIIVECPEAIAA